MIGVDTNILARYILDDDETWSPVATKFIDDECTPERPGVINPVVLAEIIWMLRQQPTYDRSKIADVVEGFLDADNLVVLESAVVAKALHDYKEGPADFADYLIAGLNAAAGAIPTVTLDKKAAQNDAFQRLVRC